MADNIDDLTSEIYFVAQNGDRVKDKDVLDVIREVEEAIYQDLEAMADTVWTYEQLQQVNEPGGKGIESIQAVPAHKIKEYFQGTPIEDETKEYYDS